MFWTRLRLFLHLLLKFLNIKYITITSLWGILRNTNCKKCQQNGLNNYTSVYNFYGFFLAKLASNDKIWPFEFPKKHERKIP